MSSDVKSYEDKEIHVETLWGTIIVIVSIQISFYINIDNSNLITELRKRRII